MRTTRDPRRWPPQLLISCGAEPKPAAPEPAKPAAAAKPADESRRFPLPNRVDTQVVDNQLLGKPFMPGGTLAHYKRGKIEYSMFIAKMPTRAGRRVPAARLEQGPDRRED